MARIILVVGEPGTGKSRAIKGLDPKTTILIKPNNKDLPFPGAKKLYIKGKNMFTLKSLKEVGAALDKVDPVTRIKSVVIEDLTHYFSDRVVGERYIKGYDKWTQLAADTKEQIIDKEAKLRDDLNIFLIGHVSSTQDASGNVSVDLQTPGKLLDNVIKVPSYVTYMLHTVVIPDENGKPRYQFLTNKDGQRAAKTPEGMFPLFIDNDFQEVIDRIEAYQNGEEYQEEEADAPPATEENQPK